MFVMILKNLELVTSGCNIKNREIKSTNDETGDKNEQHTKKNSLHMVWKGRKK